MANQGNKQSGIARRKSTTGKEVSKPVAGSRKTTATGKRDPPPRHCDVIANIEKYLLEKCKSTPFPKRVSLNSKHYKEAATMLFRLIDPNFQGFTSDKFHIEFKDLMEVVGYPYTVRQNDLQSFGAAQRLGPALDPLYWLVELYKTDEMTEEQGKQEIEEDVDLNYRLFFFNFLRSAYERWLEEGDGPVSKLDHEMTTFFAKDTSRVEQRHAELEALLNEKKAECDALEMTNDPRNSLTFEIQRLQREFEDKNQMLSKLRNDSQATVAVLDELKAGLKAECNRTSDLEVQLKRAKDEISRKAINTDELRVMLHQIRQIEQDTEVQAQKRAEIDIECRVAEEGIKSKVAALAQLTGDLNGTLKNLGVDHVIKVNDRGDTFEEILGITLESLKQKIDKQKLSPQKVSREQNRIEMERAETQREVEALNREAQDLAGEMEMMKGGRKDTGRLKRLYDKLVAEAKEKQQEIQAESQESERKLKELSNYFQELQNHVRESLERLAGEIRQANQSC